MSLGEPVPPAQQGSGEQQVQTPLSLSMQPTSVRATMPPLNIDGLTEQQAAEVVELLTPFLSPAGTPSFNAQSFASHPATPLVQQASQAGTDNAFSPLTSPALQPQPATGRGIDAHITHHQLATSQAGTHSMRSAADMASMPPPSPSITAEHILRRQQQIMLEQQALLQSPSFPSVTGGSSQVTRIAGGVRRGSQHHPYRVAGGYKNSVARSPLVTQFAGDATTPTQLTFTPVLAAGSTEKDEFLLEPLPDAALVSAAVASLHTTPVMQFSAGGHGDPGSGLSLPAAMAGDSLAMNRAGRTLHQLNVAQPQRQNSVAMAASTLSNMLGAESSAVATSQLGSWMGSQNVSSVSAAPATATPASLMNLPVSAHHLPHTTTGDIVASASTQPTAVLAAAMTATMPSSTSTVPVSLASIPQATPLMQFVSQSAPGGEFVHPPAPPPLQIGKSVVERSLPMEKDGKPVTFIKPASVTEPHTDGRKRGRRKSVTDASATSGLSKAKSDAKRGRRRSRVTPIMSPRATPLVPSILRRPSPAMSPVNPPLTSPGLTPITPAIAPRRPSSSSVTPRMAPRTPIIAATSTTNIVGLEADVVTRLATKSNYQNIIEGHSELLGLKYHTEFKSGLEKRRTNHKQAEQKRRDSLKLCFDDLKTRLPELNPKLISKIYLLNEANIFIDKLKHTTRHQERARQHVASALAAKGMDAKEIEEIFAGAEKMADEDMANEQETEVQGKGKEPAGAIERIDEQDEAEQSDAEMVDSSA
ncbi:hypothetical protein EC988_000547 [Linderina pennispora]|nr:hypothetical protein EC988_000547 [Linderina pennispora]